EFDHFGTIVRLRLEVSRWQSKSCGKIRKPGCQNITMTQGSVEEVRDGQGKI
ncbi:hypothetical protein M569_10909, partial [Genlisea aurea]